MSPDITPGVAQTPAPSLEWERAGKDIRFDLALAGWASRDGENVRLDTTGPVVGYYDER